MCNRCNDDPRDAALQAAAAFRELQGLLCDRHGVYELGEGFAILVGILNDRLEPAVEKLQNYQPRD
ncbi:MAG: hypothetical protein GW948_02095 [Rhodobacterales bacterium]|nr:hypothetical protein [Rhodobacterales bacterium]